MKKNVTQLALILACFMLAGNSFAVWPDRLAAERAFNAANSLYKENKYAEAAAAYEQILRAGMESGNLYYNLANAYFKAGQAGRAILNYERASQFIPGDSDLKSNYDYARAALNLEKQDFAGNKFILWLAKPLSGMDINGLTILLSVIYAVISLALVLRLFFAGARRLSVPAVFILSLLFILCATSLGRKINCLDSGAVVVASEAQVRFEPLESATVYFKLGEGNKVLVLESSGDWYKIKRSDAKSGWVEKPALGLISGNVIP